jgi:hypothetical protein
MIQHSERKEAKMSPKRRSVIENATVVTSTRGQGVLIPGGFILTAAHCIKWNGDGGMAMGDYFIEEVKTKSGALLRVAPLAVDPVSDIAVLGALDNQEFFKDVEAFENWREATEAVPLRMGDPDTGRPINARVLSHRGHWIKAIVTRHGLEVRSTIALKSENQIEGGTSGGPVVDHTVA